MGERPPKKTGILVRQKGRERGGGRNDSNLCKIYEKPFQSINKNQTISDLIFSAYLGCTMMRYAKTRKPDFLKYEIMPKPENMHFVKQALGLLHTTNIFWVFGFRIIFHFLHRLWNFFFAFSCFFTTNVK